MGDRVGVNIGLSLAQLISLVRAHAGVEVKLTHGLGGVALDRAGQRDAWGGTKLRDGLPLAEIGSKSDQWINCGRGCWTGQE